jgi:glycosyltransferase involved in cell wall biosynthesis
LRIGLVIYGPLQTITGGYIYDQKLVTHLSESGDEVHIISLPWRSYVNHLLFNFSSSLVQRISKLKLDILLEDELNHPSCVILNRVLRNKNQCRIISLVHHLHLDENQMGSHAVQKWIEKNYLQDVDGFIFNSRTTASSVARFAPGKPSVVAYPGKDRFASGITKSEIAERSRRNGQLRIVFLGHITPRKNLLTLIHALETLPCKEWMLTVIGSLERDRKYSRQVLEEVKSKRLDENVMFTGQISDARVAAHLRKNHVLAVPSRYEGFGIVYVEAMALGLPVIGTNVGGVSEIIEHNVNGFLTPQDDKPALTKYLTLLNRDRAMLEHMSFNAMKCYQKFPGWRDTVIKIRDFLCGTLN